MKRTLLFLAAIGALALLSGCTKENENKKSNGDKTVNIKVLTSVIGKASDKESVPAGTQTALNDAVVYFLDINDKIVNAPVKMTSAELASGKTFTGINTSAVKVYVVANITDSQTSAPLFPGISTMGTGRSKSEIEAYAASIGTQLDNTPMGINNVVLSGEASLVPSGTSNYAAAVKVTPAVCRFEVTSITGYGDITSYKLEGIYINEYYTQFTVGGGAAGTHYGFSYSENDMASVDPFMKDENLSATFTGSLNYKPANSKVWAYMLPVSASSPRIVFKLTDVTVGGIPTVPSTKYITVKNFKDANTDELIIPKRGEIYIVKDVRFQATDLTELPNQNEITVTVAVEVLNWKIFLVDPLL